MVSKDDTLKCDYMCDSLIVFFFQAEDGIRDHCVTGVQTCALPISIVMFVVDLRFKKKNYIVTLFLKYF